jgi:hypothetical protein
MTFARRNAQPAVITGPAQAGVAFSGNDGKVTFTALAAAWTSNDISVDQFEQLAIDLSTATVTTNVQYVVQRKGADGVYYPIATSAVHTDQGKTISCSIGPGVAPGPSASGAGVVDAATGNTNWTAPFDITDIVRIVVTPSGAFTGTLSVKGK